MPPFPSLSFFFFFFLFLLLLLLIPSSTPTPAPAPTPTPTPWPHQFHSVLLMATPNGSLSLVDLWYDFPNGRNLNLIHNQLGGGPPLHDVEWNNGTSFYYTLGGPAPSCRVMRFGVGILRPDWLDGADYLGRETVDGFLCNAWAKAEFIRYYEDVATRMPVKWTFYTGRSAHVMTFEVGAVLGDAKWQAPSYCFDKVEEDPNFMSKELMHKRSLRGLMEF